VFQQNQLDMSNEIDHIVQGISKRWIFKSLAKPRYLKIMKHSFLFGSYSEAPN